MPASVPSGEGEVCPSPTRPFYSHGTFDDATFPARSLSLRSHPRSAASLLEAGLRLERLSPSPLPPHEPRICAGETRYLPAAQLQREPRE